MIALMYGVGEYVRREAKNHRENIHFLRKINTEWKLLNISRTSENAFCKHCSIFIVNNIEQCITFIGILNKYLGTEKLKDST